MPGTPHWWGLGTPGSPSASGWRMSQSPHLPCQALGVHRRTSRTRGRAHAHTQWKGWEPHLWGEGRAVSLPHAPASHTQRDDTCPLACRSALGLCRTWAGPCAWHPGTEHPPGLPSPLRPSSSRTRRRSAGLTCGGGWGCGGGEGKGHGGWGSGTFHGPPGDGSIVSTNSGQAGTQPVCSVVDDVVVAIGLTLIGARAG